MKIVLLLSLLSSFVFAQDATQDLLNQQQIDIKTKNNNKNSLFKKIKSNLFFNYTLIYLGPSLSTDYQQNATFNRFKTGQDIFGRDNDYTGSYQAFHATSLGYKLTRNAFLSYNYSFQDDIYEVEYRSNNWDGSKSKMTRDQGLSYNNQQVNLWLSSVANTKHLFYNIGLTYELPTTDFARENEMLYGIGTTHNFHFKSPSLYWSYGFNFSLQRDFYRQDQYDNYFTVTLTDFETNEDFEKRVKGDPTRRQTLRAAITPYYFYSLADKYTLRASLVFDWDQHGTDALRSAEFESNLIDVGNVGILYRANNKMTLGSTLQFALEDPSVEKTALIFNMNLMI